MKKKFSYKEKTISYYDSGSGEAIILLHGYLESSEVFNDFIPELTRHARVLAMDLPGHGESDVYGNTHSMEFMAEAVKFLMDELSIKKAMIIGHSLGGYVALAFLENYAQMLYGYCLFHSHPVADTNEVIENRKREMRVVVSGKKEIIYPVNVSKMFADCNIDKFADKLVFMKEIASRTPAEGIIAVINGMIGRPSRLELLQKGDIPLLLILGKMDNYIPYDYFKGAVNLPENAIFCTLEHSGHLGFIEEKGRSQAVILEFFKKLI